MKTTIMNPSPIKNTTIRYYTAPAGHIVYLIAPILGYVMHDSEGDYIDLDGIEHLGWRKNKIACINYDFTTNPRNFYTSLEVLINAEDIT